MKIYFIVVALCYFAVDVYSHRKKALAKHHHSKQSSLTHHSKHSSLTKKGISDIKPDNLGFLDAFNENLNLKNFIQHKIEQNLQQNGLEGENTKNKFFDLKEKITHKKTVKSKHHESHHSSKPVKTIDINKDFDADDYAGDIDLDDDDEGYNSKPPTKEYNPKKKGKNTSLLKKQQSKQANQKPLSNLSKAQKTNQESNNMVSDPVGSIDTDSGSGSGGEDGSTESGQVPATVDNKSFGRIQIPQVSTSQIQANTVNSNSIGQHYPNFPVPPMIPIPLFYNSGESSGASGLNEVKPAKDIPDGFGESGYGENYPQANGYASGDWVQRILTDKEKAMRNGENDDDDDDYEEEERWMVTSSRKHHPDQPQQQTVQTTSYKTTTDGNKEGYQQKQASYSTNSQTYQSSQYGNQYPQPYSNYYSAGSQHSPPGYTLPQVYDQSQSYNQPPKQQASVPAAPPASSAASVSAASASYQEHASKPWEPPVSANQQSSYVPLMPAVTAAKSVPQPGPSLWNLYQAEKQQAKMAGECAASCPPSCAPDCDATCCTRGKIIPNIEPKPAQQYPISQWNNNQWNNIANRQAYQYPKTPDAEVNSVLPGTTIQLPDIQVGPNDAPQSANYYQPQQQQQEQQQQQNVYQQQTKPIDVAARHEVEDEPYPNEYEGNTASMYPDDQQPSKVENFEQQTVQPAAVENPPQVVQAPKPVVHLRPSDAPPPVATSTLVNNPPAAPAVPAGSNRNFALKPVQPIMLSVPSLALRKDNAESVRYPDAPCIKGCETKCFPFCSNSCCGIAT